MNLFRFGSILLLVGVAHATCSDDDTCTEDNDASSMLQAQLSVDELKGASAEEVGEPAALIEYEEVDTEEAQQADSSDEKWPGFWNRYNRGGSGGRGNRGYGNRGGTPAPPPAPPSPPSNEGGVNDADAATWLLNHNYYRCIHNTPEIQWDNDVAEGCQKHAATGRMSHSKCYSIPAPRGPSGENLAAGQRDIAAAVRAWYNESPEKGPRCGGHCTALLWKKSIALGCSKKNTWNGNRPLYVCRYAKTAANYGSKEDGVNAQDMSRECECYNKFPVPQRWGNGGDCPKSSSKPAASKPEKEKEEEEKEKEEEEEKEEEKQEPRRNTPPRPRPASRPAQNAGGSNSGSAADLAALKKRIADLERSLQEVKSLVSKALR